MRTRVTIIWLPIAQQLRRIVGMNQLPYWPIASLLLVPVVSYLGLRAYSVLLARFDHERRNVKQISELHLATIEALARAIDAKDGTAENHIRRVQIYATAVARELGMSDVEVQAVQYGRAAARHRQARRARAHPREAGPLTPEEFQKVQAHPQVGADIIATVPFPYPVAPLILSHHERWDGRGYPRGLKGEEIPLGARILCLVDYFDALTSERPYHEAMAVRCGGRADRAGSRQGARPASRRGIPASPAARSRGSRGCRRAQSARRPTAQTAPIARRRRSSTTSPSHTARSTRCTRSRRRWARASACRTRWRYIASKLTTLVPFSACTLFLYDESDERCDVPVRDRAPTSS